MLRGVGKERSDNNAVRHFCDLMKSQVRKDYAVQSWRERYEKTGVDQSASKKERLEKHTIMQALQDVNNFTAENHPFSEQIKTDASATGEISYALWRVRFIVRRKNFLFRGASAAFVSHENSACALQTDCIRYAASHALTPIALAGHSQRASPLLGSISIRLIAREPTRLSFTFSRGQKKFYASPPTSSPANVTRPVSEAIPAHRKNGNRGRNGRPRY
jgi:hypothetical protein